MDKQLTKTAIRAIDSVKALWNTLDDIHKGPQFTKAIEDLEKWKVYLAEYLEK